MQEVGTVKRSEDPSSETTEPQAGTSIDEFVPAQSDDATDGDTADGSATAVRSDGGTVGSDSPFETTASVAETRSDRIDRFLEEYIRTPWSILRTDWRALAAFAILGTYILIATVGVYLVEPTEPAHGPQLLAPFQNWEFPLGTTSSGKDVLSLAVHSTPSILIMMASGAVFTVVIGSLFGIVAGYKGGIVDTVLSTITDVFINIPGLPLVIVLATLLEEWINNPVTLGVLLAVAAWAGLARAIRSQVLTIRSESFIEAARAMDLPMRWILLREIVPHLMPYIVVNMMNAARRVIFAAVALYFLGVLPFSDANWGVMLNNAYNSGALYRLSAVHWLLVPMIAITGIAIGLILLAQSLDQVFNPRIRARHQDLGDDDQLEPDSETDTKDMMNV
ncbi:ABC transporter permease [Halopiger xanaduensis]|uniref:ABC-type transporter, integral membrane subunit n=1 Tax=Halopiger xanaduensis (strain DSM 18323 / JCM 14033 / SH-6) TaxID=797210 RepID=F8DDF2_HALXS|nr:ABC-type transporter, integral membrane subunit [Halopiger xanaduensis SH-6]